MGSAKTSMWLPPSGGRKAIGGVVMRNRMVAAFALCATAILPVRAATENWPSWRGPSHNGISTETNLPITWSQHQNVVWKMPMPALSGSTPIVWGDRIFLNVADHLPSTGTVDL